jgi:hypothetical protein
LFQPDVDRRACLHRLAGAQVQENMTSGYISVAQVLIDHAEVFTRGIAGYA